MADYRPDDHRYDSIAYRRCGRSGILLPGISLGLWHNFGGVDTEENSRAMIHTAFDLGITHFDLANNYGPPPGSAEETFGRILAQDLQRYRDELIISSKAGYRMWPGPYGEWGSRKYLVASLDQSLRRMGLEYVDIFYSHRPDPDTPLEETMQALGRSPGQGPLCRDLFLYRRTDPRSRSDPERPRHPMPHSPAQLLHVQPLDRRRPPRCPRRSRHRLHRILSARTGDAHS